MKEILHQLIGSLSHCLQGFLHPRWCKIPSTNSRTIILDILSYFMLFPLPAAMGSVWRAKVWHASCSNFTCRFHTMLFWYFTQQEIAVRPRKHHCKLTKHLPSSDQTLIEVLKTTTTPPEFQKDMAIWKIATNPISVSWKKSTNPGEALRNMSLPPITSFQPPQP